MTTTTTRRPAYIAPEGSDIDSLTEVPATTLKATSLRPGMVLLDPEFGTPAAVIDHRIGTSRGTVTYLVNDLDTGGWTQARFHEHAQVKVQAR